MAISAAQCRAARALLDWTQDQLAVNAQVARATIADFEANNRRPMRQNVISIIASFEAAGVAFIPENGGGVGVRYRKIAAEDKLIKGEYVSDGSYYSRSSRVS